jgi:hypothetical protein
MCVCIRGARVRACVCVCAQIEQVALASNAAATTRYYAAVCCAQLRYSHRDSALAARLVLMYLRLFTVLSRESIDVQVRQALPRW